MDEEAGAHTVTRGTEAGAALGAALEVDLGRVLGDQDAPSPRSAPRALQMRCEDHLRIDVSIAEKAVGGHLVAPAAELPQDQRALRHHLLELQLVAPIEPQIAHGPLLNQTPPLWNHAAASCTPSHTVTPHPQMPKRPLRRRSVNAVAASGERDRVRGRCRNEPGARRRFGAMRRPSLRCRSCACSTGSTRRGQQSRPLNFRSRPGCC